MACSYLFRKTTRLHPAQKIQTVDLLLRLCVFFQRVCVFFFFFLKRRIPRCLRVRNITTKVWFTCDRPHHELETNTKVTTLLLNRTFWEMGGHKTHTHTHTQKFRKSLQPQSDSFKNHAELEGRGQKTFILPFKTQLSSHTHISVDFVMIWLQLLVSEGSFALVGVTLGALEHLKNRSCENMKAKWWRGYLSSQASDTTTINILL